MMKLKGIIETDFRFALVQIAFGEKDGKDFGQVSFPIMGDMHNDVDEAKLTDTTADFIFDINGMPSNIHLEKNNDQWQGTFEMKSISLKLDLTIKQISDEPDFAEHAYIIPQINIEKLRQHNEYINEPCKEILKYELDNQKYLIMSKKKELMLKIIITFQLFVLYKKRWLNSTTMMALTIVMIKKISAQLPKLNLHKNKTIIQTVEAWQ